MSLRKYWGKLTLSIAAMFWAGCDGDNSVTESVVEESSSSGGDSEYPYVLKKDSSVHCKDSVYAYHNECPQTSSASSDIGDVQPLYGVVNPVCKDTYYETTKYDCEDGTSVPSYMYVEKDGVLYTREEYDESFGNSSSSSSK